MQLMDDALFDLWNNDLCLEEDVVAKSNNPGELKQRIQRAKRGEFDDEEDEDDDDFDDDDDDDDDE